MVTHETKLRVRYGETDQMGYVYYGNYALYYETGRTEMLRSMGVTYKSFEESGIMMPVTQMSCRYHKATLYDEELTIRTIIRQMPTAQIRFEYELTNEKGELVNTGETTLVFINKQTKRPTRAPSVLNDLLRPYFSS